MLTATLTRCRSFDQGTTDWDKAEPLATGGGILKVGMHTQSAGGVKYFQISKAFIVGQSASLPVGRRVL